jgi:hypothetical protein
VVDLRGSGSWRGERRHLCVCEAATTTTATSAGISIRLSSLFTGGGFVAVAVVVVDL